MAAAAQIELVTLVVDDYAPAIDFFVGALGFELVEDSPSLTNDGRPKRCPPAHDRRCRGEPLGPARSDHSQASKTPHDSSQYSQQASS